jgi:nucleoside-diphosphate-sugar epimerase
VRSTKREDKLAPIRDGMGADIFDQIELVEADLLDDDSVAAAIQGSVYVMHTASPFVLQEPDDEMELIKPALDGTLAVLKACKTHKVKHVVVTSSVVAVKQVAAEDRPADGIFTEANWSDTDKSKSGISSYSKSKTLAERAAWDFHAALSDDDKFDLTVCNPAFIIGPAWPTGDFASGQVMKGLMLP